MWPNAKKNAITKLVKIAAVSMDINKTKVLVSA